MIARIIGYFGSDGLLHIIVCCAIVSVLSLVTPLWVSVSITAAIGAAKELIWDKLLHRGSFEVKDLIADAIGILLGIL